MQGAILHFAQMQQADLSNAQLQEADLTGAQLQGAYLSMAQLQKAKLFLAQMQQAGLFGAGLQEAIVSRAQLQGAMLAKAQLQKADISEAQLQKANLSGAQLQEADLNKSQLQETNLCSAHLEGADLSNVALGNQQRIGPRLADVQWGNTNLAVVGWAQVSKLGDEHLARQDKTNDGKKKDKYTRLDEYQAAVRANRQLAVALRNQGLNEEADRFAYRAQLCQRTVLWFQGWHSWAKWLGSWFLALLAGYGYRPMRTILWYLFIIGSFAIANSVVGHLPLLPDSLVFSLMSFHGRGFFPSLSGETSLHNSVVILAAAEAVVGLLIEVSFIATFTQRFFAK